jgi:lipopolysaccharide/colanic/teichoic acid biosynthesis glycosyltransferase
LIYRNYLKRAFDFGASLFGIIFLLPLYALIAWWIKASSKGPVIYAQKRLGVDFVEFEMYKFRSMVVDAEAKGPSVTSGDDPRITKVGKIIRRTKIDELPQLFNVLKGDMSLVGPRPEVMKFASQKREEYKKVLSVRPGITDNAAIAFRDEEKMLEKYEDKESAYIEHILPQKIELYYQYIENISFANDVKLILQTLKVI